MSVKPTSFRQEHFRRRHGGETNCSEGRSQPASEQITPRWQCTRKPEITYVPAQTDLTTRSAQRADHDGG